MQIKGGCHCGNISFLLDWPGAGADIAARTCACSFCVKHGGNWTSHRDAALDVQVADAALVSAYRFGTGTAVFHVCSRCGVTPFVSSTIDGRLYAVVNANTFDGMDLSALPKKPASFDGEGEGERLARRQRNWIRSVRIGGI